MSRNKSGLLSKTSQEGSQEAHEKAIKFTVKDFSAFFSMYPISIDEDYTSGHQHHPSPIINVHGESHRDTRGPHIAWWYPYSNASYRWTTVLEFYKCTPSGLKFECLHFRRWRLKCTKPCQIIIAGPTNVHIPHINGDQNHPYIYMMSWIVPRTFNELQGSVRKRRISQTTFKP